MPSLRGRLPSTVMMALMVLCAFTLRLYALGRQSLWLDEGASFSIASSPLTSILEQTFTLEPNPPLYYVLLHGWMSVAGQTEFALRFLSLVPSVLLIPVLYRLGRMLAGQRVGLFSATLASGSPYLVWYSQEARMYALLACLAAASGLALLQAIRTGSWRAWVCFFILSGATLYTHLYGLFTVTALLLAAVVMDRSRRSAVRVILCALGLAVIYAPWLWATYTHRSQAPDWRAPVEILDIVGDTAAAFAHGPFLDGPAADWAAWGGVGLATIGVLVLVWRRQRTINQPDSRAAVLGLSIVVPLLVAYAASLAEPIYAERYVAAVAPFYYLAIAASIALLWRWFPIVVVAGVMAALYWPALTTSWSDARFQKEEFRAAATFVQQRASEDDVVILAAPFISMPFGYYYRGAAAVVPFGGEYDNPQPFLDGVLTNKRTVWLVTSHIENVDPNRKLSSWLASRYPENTEAYPKGIHINAFDLSYRLTALPQDATAVEARFEGGLTLVGYRADTALSPGDTVLHPPSNWLHATLYWRTDEPAAVNLVSEAYLLDSNAGIWGGKLHRPTDVGSVYPTRQRAVGDLVVDEVDVNLNPASSAGEYLLAVGLLRPDGGAVPLVSTSLRSGGAGNLVLLATVTILDQ